MWPVLYLELPAVSTTTGNTGSFPTVWARDRPPCASGTWSGSGYTSSASACIRTDPDSPDPRSCRTRAPSPAPGSWRSGHQGHRGHCHLVWRYRFIMFIIHNVLLLYQTTTYTLKQFSQSIIIYFLSNASNINIIHDPIKLHINTARRYKWLKWN